MTESCRNIPENTIFWFLITGRQNAIAWFQIAQLHRFWTALTKCEIITWIYISSGLAWILPKAHFKCLIVNTERIEVKNGRKTHGWKEHFQNPPLQEGGHPAAEQSLPYSSRTLKSKKSESSFFQHEAHTKSWITNFCRKCEIAVIFLESKCFYLGNSYTNNLCPWD